MSNAVHAITGSRCCGEHSITNAIQVMPGYRRYRREQIIIGEVVRAETATIARHGFVMRLLVLETFLGRTVVKSAHIRSSSLVARSFAKTIVSLITLATVVSDSATQSTQPIQPTTAVLVLSLACYLAELTVAELTVATCVRWELCLLLELHFCEARRVR